MSSLNTEDLPSTTEEVGEEGQLMYAGNVRPRSIPYGNSRSNVNRPGWATRQPEQTLICYKCYVKHKHDSNGCDLKLENLNQVIFNFEVITPAEQ